MPRSFVPGVVSEPVAVDIRSFGVRTPAWPKKPNLWNYWYVPCFTPKFGLVMAISSTSAVMLIQSITDTGGGMKSEGVGTYWPLLQVDM